MPRSYTLAEINEMRAALYAIECAPYNAYLEKHGHMEYSHSPWDAAKKEAEKKLRTAMIGGVDPAEIIAMRAAIGAGK